MNEKQLAAAHASGAKSHGLCFELAINNRGSKEAFETLRQSYLERFHPHDLVELDLVEQMAAATWRVRRLWAIEAEVPIDSMNNVRHLAKLARARLNRLHKQVFQTFVELRRQNITGS